MMPVSPRQILRASRTVQLQSDARVRVNQSVRVGRVCEQSVDINRLVILDDALDWIVSDVLIGDASQFLHSGDIPRGLFAEGVVLGHHNAQALLGAWHQIVGASPWHQIVGAGWQNSGVDNFARFDTAAAGARVEVIVSYVGADPEGRVFSAELRGQEPLME